MTGEGATQRTLRPRKRQRKEVGKSEHPFQVWIRRKSNKAARRQQEQAIWSGSRKRRNGKQNRLTDIINFLTVVFLNNWKAKAKTLGEDGQETADFWCSFLLLVQSLPNHKVTIVYFFFTNVSYYIIIAYNFFKVNCIPALRDKLKTEGRILVTLTHWIIVYKLKKNISCIFSSWKKPFQS